MDCIWLKPSSSLTKGISIINLLNDFRFEQFLRRIVSKLKLQEYEIFSNDEVQKLVKIFELDEDSMLLAIKTLVYIFRRLLKYICMPINLKKDLKSIGIIDEKADFIVQLWSSETRTALDELGSDTINKPNDNLGFTWCVNAELSSEYCKKTKLPKAYVSLTRDEEDIQIELTHPELYAMFLQFEAIQNELDNMGI